MNRNANQKQRLGLGQVLAKVAQCLQAGQLDQAESICRQILATTPAEPNTLHYLGVILFQKGNLSDGVDVLRRAVSIEPTNAQIHYHLGCALRENKQFVEATATFTKAIELKDAYTEAYRALGLTLADMGQIEEGIAEIQRVIAIEPDNVKAHMNLGNMRQEQNKAPEAIAAFRQAIALDPNHAPAYNNLGKALRIQKQVKAATEAFQKATDLNPAYALAYNNLGGILTEQGKLPEAIAALKRAVTLEPTNAQTHHHFALALAAAGDIAAAIAAEEQTLKLKGDHWRALSHLINLRQSVCLWSGLKELIERLIQGIEEGVALASPFFFQLIETSSRQQQQCARLYAKGAFQHAVALRKTLGFDERIVAKPQITIGYISADFRDHAAASLIAELFEQHDRDRFRVLGYSIGPDDQSDMRQRLVRAFDQFVDLREMPLEQAARKIYEDEVDILVDLTGLTRHSRTEILALRPAPIQINYLGSGSTLGADFMDYMIVDQFIVRPEQETFYDEKLVYLPDCFLVNDAKQPISPETPSRSECGLPEDAFVFCCFNNNFKINPEILDVWVNLLSAVESSVLWLIETNQFVSKNLKQEAKARGIDPDRLIFAPFVPRQEHMARYRIVDLFLDTPVVSAGATASDALLVGCPLITCTGNTLQSRVAGSMLHAVGLPELVTTSLADYESLALRLAENPSELKAIRKKLAKNLPTAPLFDCARSTRNVEQAYEVMWRRHLEGLARESFVVSPAENATDEKTS